MSDDHRIHVIGFGDGRADTQLECTHAPDAYPLWLERVRQPCRCIGSAEPCKACLDGDHAGCLTFGGRWIVDIGYECQCDPSEGCCVAEWWDADSEGIVCYLQGPPPWDVTTSWSSAGPCLEQVQS